MAIREQKIHLVRRANDSMTVCGYPKRESKIGLETTATCSNCIRRYFRRDHNIELPRKRPADEQGISQSVDFTGPMKPPRKTTRDKRGTWAFNRATGAGTWVTPGNEQGSER